VLVLQELMNMDMAGNSRFPDRLQDGDVVRVISFGLSLKGASLAQRETCNSRLSELGLTVTFGKHVEVSDEFDSSSIAARIADLDDALLDNTVKIIMPGLGGMNAAQILRHIDWNLLSEHPKIFCGFSDMATLVNAIYAKTGLVTYYGPFYGTFGMTHGIEYALEGFRQCLFTSEPFSVTPAPYWSDDAWWLDQENRIFQKNVGPIVLNEGEAQGTLIGGHLTSFSTLFGTEFMPDLTDSILLIEENSDIRPRSFDRLLQMLIHQPNFDKVRGILIGRFTSHTEFTDEILKRIVENYPQLSRMPVVSNLSFGHTYPQATLPIGGMGQIIAWKNDRPVFNILTH